MPLTPAAYPESRTLNESRVVLCFLIQHCDSSTSAERDLQPATAAHSYLSRSQERPRSLQGPGPGLLQSSIEPAIISAPVFVAPTQRQDLGGTRAAKFAQTRFPIRAQRSRIQDEPFAATLTP